MIHTDQVQRNPFGVFHAVMYSPYFPHLLEAWNLRHHPNLLFIFYEDLKRVSDRLVAMRNV